MEIDLHPDITAGTTTGTTGTHLTTLLVSLTMTPRTTLMTAIVTSIPNHAADAVVRNTVHLDLTIAAQNVQRGEKTVIVVASPTTLLQCVNHVGKLFEVSHLCL